MADIPVDTVFLAALNYFLETRELTIQRLCDRTKKYSEDRKTVLIHPIQISRWRSTQWPASRQVDILCRTLGVSRSFFYLVGEILEQAREQAEAAGRHADECLFRILLGADGNVPEIEKLIARARRARKAKTRL
jgi:hypothetical protein